MLRSTQHDKEGKRSIYWLVIRIRIMKLHLHPIKFVLRIWLYIHFIHNDVPLCSQLVNHTWRTHFLEPVAYFPAERHCLHGELLGNGFAIYRFDVAACCKMRSLCFEYCICLSLEIGVFRSRKVETAPSAQSVEECKILYLIQAFGKYAERELVAYLYGLRLVARIDQICTYNACVGVLVE